MALTHEPGMPDTCRGETAETEASLRAVSERARTMYFQALKDLKSPVKGPPAPLFRPVGQLPRGL